MIRCCYLSLFMIWVLLVTQITAFGQVNSQKDTIIVEAIRGDPTASKIKGKNQVRICFGTVEFEDKSHIMSYTFSRKENVYMARMEFPIYSKLKNWHINIHAYVVEHDSVGLNHKLRDFIQIERTGSKSERISIPLNLLISDSSFMTISISVGVRNNENLSPCDIYSRGKFIEKGRQYGYVADKDSLFEYTPFPVKPEFDVIPDFTFYFID